jgi:tagatose 1,6-diphosphate aldolase
MPRYKAFTRTVQEQLTKAIHEPAVHMLAVKGGGRSGEEHTLPAELTELEGDCMSIRLSEGKIAGLKAVADERGVISAAALDQRGLLARMIAKELGSEPTAVMVSQFKELVAAAITRHASAILLDVEYGLPAMKHCNGKGVLLAYEKSAYEATAPEFLPILTEGWSVLRLKQQGASAVKILLFYSPFEKPWVNAQKQAWVERIGAECKALDIPLFLELLAYDAESDGKGLAYAKRKPEIVIRSVEQFSAEKYGADVLKLEPPVDMRFVPGTLLFQGETAYSRAEAQEIFRAAEAATSKPFVYLSAGVTNQAFVETLEFAFASGVRFHGVLCGRATWQDGVPVFAKHGPQALEEWLETKGAENVQNVNRVLQAAHPWHEKYDGAPVPVG